MKFKTYIPEQIFLIPPNIEDEIPKDDIVRVVNQVIEELSMDVFEKKYQEIGNTAYNPRMMLKVILYSYQQGIFSSRKMEKAAERNIYYWYLTGKQKPNFRTLCKFIRRHQEEIEDVFSQVLWICSKRGLVNLQTVAVDGSLLKANASKDALWDSKRVQSELKKVRKLASEYLSQHLEIDEMEAKLEAESKKLKKVKKQSESAPEVSDLLAQLEDIKKIEESLSKTDKKRINTTDPDASLLGKKCDPKKMGYNSNILVESSNQVIVSAELDNQVSESHMVPNHINYLQNTLKQLPNFVLGDSAYSGQSTIHYLNECGLKPVTPKFHIQYYKDKTFPNMNTTKLFSSDSFEGLSNEEFMICPARKVLKRGQVRHEKGKTPYHVYSNPKACRCCFIKHLCTSSKYRDVCRGIYFSEVKAVENYLKTPEGYKKYKERIGIVEPVFGNIKWNKGFKLTFRGLRSVKTQFKLACIMHNIEKLAKSYKNNLLPNFFLLKNLSIHCFQTFSENFLNGFRIFSSHSKLTSFSPKLL